MTELLETESLGTNATGSAQLSARVEESARLSRFCNRLLGEALDLQVDQVTFTLNQQQLFGSFIRQKTELKSLEIKASWFLPLLHWLFERASIINARAELTPLSLSLDEREITFHAAVRIDRGIVRFKVFRQLTLNKRHVLTLSQFSLESVSQALLQLGIATSQVAQVERLLDADHGCVLAAAPDPEHLVRTRAALLSLSHLQGAVEVAAGVPMKELRELSSKFGLLLWVRADDAVEALSKCTEQQIDFNSLQFSLVVCQGETKRVCQSCARDSTLDSALVKKLPPIVAKRKITHYRIGRGCDACQQSGYNGFIGVQSIAILDQEALQLLASDGAQASALVAHLRQQGTRSLFENGLEKVLSNIITMESLVSVTKTIPIYHQHFVDAADSKGEKPKVEKSLEVDFFEGTAIVATPKPLKGRAAFTGNESDSEDAPLFSVGRTGVVRSKPLILVVEDDADQRSILEMVFRSTGYEVNLANDGVEALQRIEESLPDLVVTDIMMPNMDGVEFVRKLKENSKHKLIPILVLTVLADSDREYSMLDLGADDYCEKTIQRKVLLKRVERLVKRKR